MGGGTGIYLDQVHGGGILRISSRHARNGKAPGPVLTGDAAVTDVPGLFSVIQVADCQAVLLCDPVRKVTANVHSGWRGSIGDIIGRTVCAMQRYYGSSPADILAAVGPSLGPCCAEFVHFKKEFPEHLWKYRVAGARFDFWAMSRDQLISRGVLPGNIQTAGICTRCRTDLFFSYRGEKVTGRFAVAIGFEAGVCQES